MRMPRPPPPATAFTTAAALFPSAARKARASSMPVGPLVPRSTGTPQRSARARAPSPMRIAISPRLATSRRARLIDGGSYTSVRIRAKRRAAGGGPPGGALSAAGLEHAKKNQAFARHSDEVRGGPQPPYPRDVDDGVHQPCPEEHGGAEAGLVVGQSGGVHHEHEGGEVREVLEHVALRAPCPLGPWRQGRRGLPVPEDLSHGPERPHGEAVRKHQGAGENGARGQHDQVGGHIVLHSTSPSSERRIIVRLNAAIQRTAGIPPPRSTGPPN